MSMRSAVVAAVIAFSSVAAACDTHHITSASPALQGKAASPAREPVFVKPLAAAGAGAATTALTTADMGVHNVAQLAAALAGPGVVVSNASYIGGGLSAGTFGGGIGIIGFEDGVILSTGDIGSVRGTNTTSGMTGVVGADGDDGLSWMAQASTFDAAVLSFDFVASGPRVHLQYVFASEEYNEFVGSEYSDAFAIWINGVNCATVPGAQPVTINTVNHGAFASMNDAVNPGLYVNNDPWHGQMNPAGLRETEMDGLTVVLTCSAVVTPGSVNTMRIAIADVGDHHYDSNLFLSRHSLSTAAPAPNAPEGLHGVPMSTTRIDLEWLDVSSSETRFQLQRRDYVGGAWSAYSTIVNTAADATSFSDTGVAADVRYQYRLRSCLNSSCSDWQYAVPVATTVPVRPGAVTAVAMGERIVALAWEDRSSNESAFRIERREAAAGGSYGDWDLVDWTNRGVMSYWDESVASNTQYQYRVSACNGIGCSAPTTSAAVTTPGQTLPAMPSYATAYVVSATELIVWWGDASDNESSFRVQRGMRVDGTWGSWSNVATLPAESTSHSDTGLLPSTTYRYRIRSCNSAGCSDWVQTQAISTPAAGPQPAAKPTGLSFATGDSNTAMVLLNWTDEAMDEYSYQVQRRQQLANGTWPAWTLLANLPPDATQYLDLAVANSTAYQYRVRACNEVGCSAWVGTGTAYTNPAEW